MDWDKLRKDFFAECVDERGSEFGISPRVNMHPHNLFEWFKKHLQQFESKMEKEHYPEESKYSKLFAHLKQEANWIPLTSEMDDLISIVKEILQSESGKRKRPKIICLCGSGRFKDAFEQAEFEHTLGGAIVLTIGCNTKDIARDVDWQHFKPMLDELHKRKIDLADEIFVLNVGGYIGKSTRSEIKYTEKLGKPIVYLETLTPSTQKERE